MTQETVTEFRSKDTWTIFRIMAEFVEGFETLGPIWPAVSVFGGRARRPTAILPLGTGDRPQLGREGFAVITGGGPARWRRPTAARTRSKRRRRAQHQAALRADANG